jgi:ubiquinone/menaquinone biosynthesis C-methylase UbiE
MKTMLRYVHFLSNFIRWLPLIVEQKRKQQTLGRTPEPAAVMQEDESVLQYDKAASTSLFISYACALEIIYKCVGRVHGEAIDLACGTGNFSLAALTYLKPKKMTGIDLSQTMLDQAKENGRRLGAEQHIELLQANVLELDELPDNKWMLATFTGTAHHLDRLQQVEDVLRTMERITMDDGLVFLMDLVRLKEEGLTNRFVETIGRDFHKQGIGVFFDDFRHSMFAAWTEEELRLAIPKESRRTWIHLRPKGLPVLQILLGLPIGQDQAFRNTGVPWSKADNPIPKQGKRI